MPEPHLNTHQPSSDSDLAHSQVGALIQLHTSEYQALSTRASYWIVLQVGLLPLIPLYLAMATQVWQYGPSIKRVVIWTTLGGYKLWESYGLKRWLSNTA